MNKNTTYIRIHGDNIVECERAMELIALAYNSEPVRIDSPIYMPAFRIMKSINEFIVVELLGGHNKWNVDVNAELAKNGAPLREATDAYITLLSSDFKKETLLIAIEFCSALPAGNNAWQRNGRAITCAEIGVPYLYYAEIGGVELDENRNVKAPRFPNPIVPFSYIAATNSIGVVCIPVYQPHPAITKALDDRFKESFGKHESVSLLRSIIEQEDFTNYLPPLIQKGTDLVTILSEDRKRVDTFTGDEWTQILQLKSGKEKAEWIEKNPTRQIWIKKSAGKVDVTSTFTQLANDIRKIECLSVGAKAIPICLVPKSKIGSLVKVLNNIYQSSPNINKVAKEISIKNNAIVIVWVTGFKPRGDDSRPDRGLLPLARMLFGNDIDILTIVSGPAKPYTWDVFKTNPKKLVSDNGLWQAILNLSNYVIADSVTSTHGALGHISKRNLDRTNNTIVFDAARAIQVYSEHDVDTAIHTMFSRRLDMNIFESMCNPPGGDWSGVSYRDFENNEEYRWTSLPRVSKDFAKRPDHVIQFRLNGKNVFLQIESKNFAKNLEHNIGIRLNDYVDKLFKLAPTAYKTQASEWISYTSSSISSISDYATISAGAFCYKNDEELHLAIENGGLDAVFAFEFNDNALSIVHVLLAGEGKLLEGIFTEIGTSSISRFEIKIH